MHHRTCTPDCTYLGRTMDQLSRGRSDRSRPAPAHRERVEFHFLSKHPHCHQKQARRDLSVDPLSADLPHAAALEQTQDAPGSSLARKSRGGRCTDLVHTLPFSQAVSRPCSETRQSGSHSHSCRVEIGDVGQHSRASGGMHCCLCWRKVCARVAGKRVGRWQKAVSGPHNETNPGQLRTAGKVGACHRTPGRLEPPPAIYEFKLEHRGFSCCLRPATSDPH